MSPYFAAFLSRHDRATRKRRQLCIASPEFRIPGIPIPGIPIPGIPEFPWGALQYHVPVFSRILFTPR